MSLFLKKGRRSRIVKSLPVSAEVDLLEDRALLAVTGPIGNTIAVSPTFTWEPVTNAVSHELWVSKLTGGVVSKIVYQPAVVGASFSMGSSQLPAATYRTWVRGNYANGSTSNWSVGADFTIAAAPQLSNLQAGQMNLAGDPMNLQWNAVSNAASYQVWANRLNSNFTTSQANIFHPTPPPPWVYGPFPPVQTEFSLTNTYSHAVSDGFYRVWIRAIDAAGMVGHWGEPRDIQVLTPDVSVMFLNPLGFTADTTPEFVINGTELPGREYELKITNTFTGVTSTVVRQTVTPLGPPPGFVGPWQLDYSMRYIPASPLSHGPYSVTARDLASTRWSDPVSFRISTFHETGNFDIAAPGSVAELGRTLLTIGNIYSDATGVGWRTGNVPQSYYNFGVGGSSVFKDGVIIAGAEAFSATVPNGIYTVTISTSRSFYSTVPTTYNGVRLMAEGVDKGIFSPPLNTSQTYSVANIVVTDNILDLNFSRAIESYADISLLAALSFQRTA